MRDNRQPSLAMAGQWKRLESVGVAKTRTAQQKWRRAEHSDTPESPAHETQRK